MRGGKQAENQSWKNGDTCEDSFLFSEQAKKIAVVESTAIITLETDLNREPPGIRFFSEKLDEVRIPTSVIPRDIKLRSSNSPI